MEEEQKALLVSSLNELKAWWNEDDVDYKAVTAACEKLLNTLATTTTTTSSSDPELTKTLQVIVYEIYLKSLLQLEEFTSVVDAKAPSQACQVVAAPLQAYALYRLGQYDKASAAAASTTTTTAASTATESPSIQHLQAQIFFHTHDTVQALAAYEKLLKLDNTDTDDDETALLDVWTNAVAVVAANATPYHGLTITTGAVADSDLAQRALDVYKSTTNDTTSSDKEDLAYNLATVQLLSSHTSAARREALQLLGSVSNANALWGRAFWGEDEALLGASSTTKANSSSSSSSSSSVNGILEQVNAVLGQPAGTASRKTIDRTLQLMQLLLLPGGKLKVTALQTRLCRYNRAVLQIVQTQQYDAGRKSLMELKQSLNSTGAGAAGGGAAASKKKKKTIAATAGSSELDSLWWHVRCDVLLAYSYYFAIQDNRDSGDDEDEELATSNSNKETAEQQKGLKHVLQSLETLRKDLVGSDNKVRAHSLVYLDLHLMQLQNPSGDLSSDDQFQWLQQQQHTKMTAPHPAVTASIAKGFQDRNQPDKAKEFLLASDSADHIDTILAELAMSQEQYVEAVTLFEQAIAKASGSSDGANAIRARLVEALSHVDTDRAMVEWKKLEGDYNNNNTEEEDRDDGEALELRALPRIKHASQATSGLVGVDTTSGGASGGLAGLTTTKKTPKSKAAVLRRRAKQREKYLVELEEKGRYNPSRPTQPDAERWIPKHERQRFRRRNRNNNNKSSQGGAVSAKDAAKLDVLARKNGAVEVPSGTSTAHMSVAGGKNFRGRR